MWSSSKMAKSTSNTKSSLGLVFVTCSQKTKHRINHPSNEWPFGKAPKHAKSKSPDKRKPRNGPRKSKGFNFESSGFLPGCSICCPDSRRVRTFCYCQVSQVSQSGLFFYFFSQRSIIKFLSSYRFFCWCFGNTSFCFSFRRLNVLSLWLEFLTGPSVDQLGGLRAQVLPFSWRGRLSPPGGATSSSSVFLWLHFLYQESGSVFRFKIIFCYCYLMVFGSL